MTSSDWLKVLRPDALEEMRAFVAECVGEDCSDLDGLEVVRAVRTLYPGGVARFLADGRFLPVCGRATGRE